MSFSPVTAYQHLYSRDGAVISNNGVISGTHAEIEALKTLIGKVNATLTKRIDTQYEENDGHHETLNNTIHLKHSDLVQAVDALKKEIGSKITQLETALRSKVDSDRQDVQGKLFLYQWSTYTILYGWPGLLYCYADEFCTLVFLRDIAPVR